MHVPSLGSRVQASVDVVFRDLDGEMVLLDLRSGIYFSLDGVGTRVWQLIEQHGCLADVLAALTHEYDVPAARCAADLLAFVALLGEKGLLEVRLGAGA
jgi:hypothetical protein